MKTGLHDRRRARQRAPVAPDTGPMTGSSNYQQPSTIRGEAHTCQGRERGFVGSVVFTGRGSPGCLLRLWSGRRVVSAG